MSKQSRKMLVESTKVLSISILILGITVLITPTNVFAADWGQNIASKIDDIFKQLQPIVISLATLGIGFGAIQWATSGGNVDKKAMGKKIFFGAAVAIAIYFSAGAFVSWAQTNLKIEF